MSPKIIGTRDVNYMKDVTKEKKGNNRDKYNNIKLEWNE